MRSSSPTEATVGLWVRGLVLSRCVRGALEVPAVLGGLYVSVGSLRVFLGCLPPWGGDLWGP